MTAKSRFSDTHIGFNCGRVWRRLVKIFVLLGNKARIDLKASCSGVRGKPISRGAGPAGGVHREPASVLHTTSFNKHLTREFVYECKHLATAVGTETAVHVRSRYSLGSIDLIFTLDGDSVHRKDDHCCFTRARDQLAIPAMAVEGTPHLCLVKDVMDIAA